MDAKELQARIEAIKADIKATPDEDEDRLHLMWTTIKCLEAQLKLKEVMTVAELAGRLDLSYDSLIRAMREGRIEARQSGHTWLSTAEAIQAAIEAGRLRPRKQ